MACRWCIDDCSPDRIAGWIDDNGPVDSIDIAVNGRRIATLSPTDYRQDLKDAGIGDGRRSFVFGISGYLIEPVNVVSINRGEQVLHSADGTVAEGERQCRTSTGCPSCCGRSEGERKYRTSAGRTSCCGRN